MAFSCNKTNKNVCRGIAYESILLFVRVGYMFRSNRECLSVFRVRATNASGFLEKGIDRRWFKEDFKQGLRNQ